LGAERPDVTDAIAASSTATPKSHGFVLAEAPALPSLEEGGFSKEPALIDNFDAGWEASQTNWRVATWKQNGTQMSPDRCRTDGHGHMVQTVLAGEPYRGGSMQTSREFGYGRWVARVKPSPVPGLLNGIFTKDWDNLTTPDDQHDGKKGEIDIEFVTHTFGDGRGEVHLAVHLLTKHPLWHLDIPLDFDPSADFHEWGFDILPDRTVWHVDGKVLHTWMYTAEDRIDPDYEMFFNSWTRDRWLKGPPKADARYPIDRVAFYPLRAAKE
jgi:beta-glucanase (GH16 family)